MKCGESYIFSASPKNSILDKDFISRVKKDLGIKYLIDRHGKNGSVIEIVNDFTNNIYITNIFSKEKIYD
jgi:hypothetical protein